MAVKVLPVHMTTPKMSAEQRFLLDAQQKAEAFMQSHRKRNEMEQQDLNAALEDGYKVIASHVIESDQGVAIWYTLYKRDIEVSIDSMIEAAYPHTESARLVGD